MSDSTEDTIKQMSDREILMELLKRFDDQAKRFDDYAQQNDAQLEAIRQGIVDNGIAFDRLQAQVFNLRADVKELTEEVRHGRTAKVLV